MKNNLLVRRKHGKYITFTVPIEKWVTSIDKNGQEIMKYISYRLQYIDPARFMASSLWNIANNLLDKIDKIKCKNGHDDKKYEIYKIEYEYCDCFFE